MWGVVKDKHGGLNKSTAVNVAVAVGPHAGNVTKILLWRFLISSPVVPPKVAEDRLGRV